MKGESWAWFVLMASCLKASPSCCNDVKESKPTINGEISMLTLSKGKS